MKIKKVAVRKFKNVQAFAPVLVVGVLVAVGAVIYNFNAHAATAGFYFNASGNAYNVGDTITLGVYEDSGDVCANVVEADFTYPANLLTFNGFSSSNSKFESSVATPSQSGKVSIIQYTSRKECGSGGSVTSGVSGEQLIGTATFTVTAAGSATLNFEDSSIAVSAADNRTDVAPGSNSLALTLTTAPVTTNPNPTPTPPAPGPSPVPRPAPSPTPGPVNSYTPDGSDTPITVEDNDTLELNDDVDVQPLPVQPDGVKKVEYYLGDKLDATVQSAPYKYHLETDKYLNGKYNLTTKTYYNNGTTKSVSQTVVVNNPFGISQVKLWIQKYIVPVIIGLALIGVLVAALLIKRRSAGPTSYYGGDSNESTGDYAVSSGNFVTPTPSDVPTAQTPGETPTAEDPQVYKPAGPTTLK